MPGRIRLLPDGVVNQIAAGEVVERPASVLKELLENAVDAGGGFIEAQVSGPFPFSLRVSDQGCGMNADEAQMAIRRHTTSKIHAAEDLEGISTYGFRGEALPSIASVSKVRIVTRPSGVSTGTEVIVEAGKVLSVSEVGAPSGTTVEVTSLFANVPARKKFLKSPRTEMTRLWEVFHAVAIPGEGASFRFTDGRGEFSYESRESRNQRALKHAREDAKYLVPFDLSSPFFRVSGWAGLPQVSRVVSSGIFFFVNGRHFRDRGLYAAVREAYRGILPADRQPVIYLFVDCNPSEVDVNVHPAKTEARFRYGRELYELVRHSIGEVLGEHPEAVAGDAGTITPPGVERRHFHFEGSAFAGMESLFGESPEQDARRAEVDEGAGPAPRGFSGLKPIGQILGTYIVCEGGGEVVIIDQHAADERIVFSRLKDLYLGARAPVQQWIADQVVVLAGAGKPERDEVERFLTRAGFSFEPFGEDAFKIAGGPALLGHFDVRRWWDDLCEFLSSQETAPKGIFDADREIWRMACHSSVRGGDALDADRMRALLRDLDQAVASHSCPHGRPVWVKISRAEMGRMFGRT